METIKVAIADDHRLFRQGIHFLIEQMYDLELVFEASNGNELLTKLESIEADVLLLDLDMPGMDGIDALKILRPQYPDLKVIILTTYSDNKMIEYLMDLGANSYLLKDTDPETLHRAIESVYREGYFFTKNVSREMLTGLKGQVRKKPTLKNNVALTAREVEVLELICQGETARNIVDGHHLDHDTVEQHRKLLSSKFKAHLRGDKPENS